MINPTRTALKRARNDAQRWYSRMARMQDGSTEGFFDRWDRLGPDAAWRLSPPIAIIGTITRVLDSTKKSERTAKR